MKRPVSGFGLSGKNAHGTFSCASKTYSPHAAALNIHSTQFTCTAAPVRTQSVSTHNAQLHSSLLRTVQKTKEHITKSRVKGMTTNCSQKTQTSIEREVSSLCFAVPKD